MVGLEIGGRGKDNLVALIGGKLLDDAFGERGFARANVGEQINRSDTLGQVVDDFLFGRLDVGRSTRGNEDQA